MTTPTSHNFDYGTLKKMKDVLSPDQFNSLFIENESEFIAHIRKHLKFAVVRLEASCKNIGKLGEDGYSDILASILEASGITCHREKNQNGHVDLLFECTRLSLRLVGEAKVWRKEDDYRKACKQVIDLYQTGRIPHGVIVIYYSESANIWERQEANKKLFQDNGPDWFACTSITDESAYMPGSYSTKHTKDAATQIEVLHVAANLFYAS